MAYLGTRKAWLAARNKPLNISCIIKKAILDKLSEDSRDRFEVGAVGGYLTSVEPIEQVVVQSRTREFAACCAFAILKEKSRCSERAMGSELKRGHSPGEKRVKLFGEHRCQGVTGMRREETDF